MALAVAVQGLKADPLNQVHLQTLTVAVDSRCADLKEFLSSNPGMSDELVSMCCRILRLGSAGQGALAAVSKVARALEPGPDVDVIDAVLANMCLTASGLDVWATLPEASRVGSLPTIKQAVSEGKVDLKALSSCVPAQALMSALGPTILSLLSASGVAYGDKSRASTCTDCAAEIAA